MQKKLQTSFQTRQYMLSKDYEIYYYNDTKLYRVNTHTHTYYEFYFFLEGNVSMYIGEKKYLLHPGDVLLIPPGISHHAKIHNMDQPYRRFVFWITEDYVAQLMQQSIEYGYLLQNTIQYQEYVYHQDLVTANELQSKVFRLLAEVHTRRYGQEEQIRICIQDLMMMLNRKVFESNHPVSQQEVMTLYQNLLLYIEEHLDEELSLERLAKEFYVSKYHISHVFKENAGFSIHQYIVKKRLALCKNAILTGTGISQVYQQFGFSDYTSFYRAFKKEYGMSPKEYREVHTKAEDFNKKSN